MTKMETIKYRVSKFTYVDYDYCSPMLKTYYTIWRRVNYLFFFSKEVRIMRCKTKRGAYRIVDRLCQWED